MRHFWDGFYKRADAFTGGSGFTGTGKGNLPTGYAEQGRLTGDVGAADEGKTDKTLIDRQRYPKDFSPRELGEDAPADSNPHIIY